MLLERLRAMGKEMLYLTSTPWKAKRIRRSASSFGSASSPRRSRKPSRRTVEPMPAWEEYTVQPAYQVIRETPDEQEES